MFNKRIEKIFLLIFFIIVVFLSILKIKSNNYKPNEYEKELIKYFNEVALKTEHYDNPKKIIKWKGTMKLFIFNEGENIRQIEAIKKTIKTINHLATDGFKIELIDNIKKSNAFIYLCNKEKIKKLNPRFYRMFNEDIGYEVSGFANIRYDKVKNIINEVFIYIDINDPIKVQESTILEEITQSLGLANDPVTRPDSIFFENKMEDDNFISKYSKIDKDLIRLLYHPKMEAGLNFKQTQKTIINILKLEKNN